MLNVNIPLPRETQEFAARIRSRPTEIWHGDGGDVRVGAPLLCAYVAAINGHYYAVVTRQCARPAPQANNPVFTGAGDLAKEAGKVEPRAAVVEGFEDLTEISVYRDYPDLRDHLAKVIGPRAMRRIVQDGPWS